MRMYEDLDHVEQVAHKHHNGEMLMMCQILREIRELRTAVETTAPKTVNVDEIADTLSRQIQELLSEQNAITWR